MEKNSMNYNEAVEYLLNIPKYSKKTSLLNTADILKRMGSPEKNYKVIHIAGTNGKGSVSAFLNGLISSSGIKTGMFISPHLRIINERIRIDSKYVEDEEFLTAFNYVFDIIKKGEEEGIIHPSFFEFLFLMAVHIFRENSVEYAILETGLGGRLDATNSIENKVLTIITSISLDHTEILGDTVEKIAFEKAGIIKRNTPLVYLDMDKRVSKVIVDKAKIENINTYKVSKDDIHISKKSHKYIDFSVNNMYYEYCDLRINFPAIYQTENASISLLSFHVLREMDDNLKDISFDLIKKAILNVKWEGRMEEVEEGIFLDGAHNISGIESFVETINSISKSIKKHLIFSVVSDKSYKDMIDVLLRDKLFDTIYICGLNSYRGINQLTLSEEFIDRGVNNLIICDNTVDAYKKMKKNKNKEDLAFIAGSLYLAGEIKEILSNGGQDD